MGREMSVATPGPSSLEVTGESLKTIHVLTAHWFEEFLDARGPAKKVLICTYSIPFQELFALLYPLKNIMTTPLDV